MATFTNKTRNISIASFLIGLISAMPMLAHADGPIMPKPTLVDTNGIRCQRPADTIEKCLVKSWTITVPKSDGTGLTTMSLEHTEGLKFAKKQKFYKAFGDNSLKKTKFTKRGALSTSWFGLVGADKQKLVLKRQYNQVLPLSDAAAFVKLNETWKIARFDGKKTSIHPLPNGHINIKYLGGWNGQPAIGITHSWINAKTKMREFTVLDVYGNPRYTIKNASVDTDNWKIYQSDSEFGWTTDKIIGGFLGRALNPKTGKPASVLINADGSLRGYGPDIRMKRTLRKFVGPEYSWDALAVVGKAPFKNKLPDDKMYHPMLADGTLMEAPKDFLGMVRLNTHINAHSYNKDRTMPVGFILVFKNTHGYYYKLGSVPHTATFRRLNKRSAFNVLAIADTLQPIANIEHTDYPNISDPRSTMDMKFYLMPFSKYQADGLTPVNWTPSGRWYSDYINEDGLHFTAAQKWMGTNWRSVREAGNHLFRNERAYEAAQIKRKEEQAIVSAEYDRRESARRQHEQAAYEAEYFRKAQEQAAADKKAHEEWWIEQKWKQFGKPGCYTIHGYWRCY